jgi:predicted site-specific integrase-resolvase
VSQEEHGGKLVRHLNQEQLAERLGVSQRTLEGWRSRGKGPVYLRLGGRVAYRVIDIERFEIECLQSGSRVRSGES